jgi:hypothetical protein
MDGAFPAPNDGTAVAARSSNPFVSADVHLVSNAVPVDVFGECQPH